MKYYDCFQIIFGDIEYKNENDRDYAEYIGNEMQVLIWCKICLDLHEQSL